MPMKRNEAKRGPPSSNVDSDQPKMDIKSILNDIQYLGSSHMTWKQKKELENKKVVSLGGKPPKKQRLPLSVARVPMKRQQERDEKLREERAILGRFGAYLSSSSSSSSTKVAERRRPEQGILKSTVGNFRKGVLDVRHMLKPSAPAASNEKGKHAHGKGKKKKDGKKGNGKRKGGGKKRH